MNRYLLTRKNRLRTRQYFMLFTIFLVFISGILPSFELMTINAESDAIVEPIVSKDIEGENEKEIIPGEDYNYNVKVSLPENISGYESMTITDDFDKRLTIQDTSVLVNDEENNELQVEVNKQSVSLTLLNEQLDELVGKEITLQITTQINEETAVGEEIENIAQIVVNNDTVLETDSVYVSVLNVEKLENDLEKDEELDGELEESDESDSKSMEEAELGSPTDDEEKVTKEADLTSQKKSMNQTNDIQPLNNGGITMNDTDFYAITTDGWLVQFEGDPDLINANNGQTWEKARVKANLKDGVNGLGKTSDGFYVTGNRGSGVRNLFKIDPDGTTTKVADGVSSASATMTEDGEKFVFMSDNTISIIDLNTSVRTNKTLYNTTNTPLEHKSNGDIIIDGEGYVWHATHGQGGSNLIRINIDTGEIDRIIPIKNANGGDLDKTAGIAFLNDGRIAVHSNSDGQN